jgi:ubiquinone/menaquinone biosynthesis C-methylase UbiE
MDYKYISKSYNELHEEEQLKKITILKKYLKINEKTTLLDVGCGTGISTFNFHCKVKGIDPSKEMISIAKNKKLIQGYAEKLPFKDKSFDIVVSVTAIHNFKDPEKGLDEINRVAKKQIAITLLKKSNNYKKIKDLIYKKLKNIKEIDEEKDTIFISYLDLLV